MGAVHISSGPTVDFFVVVLLDSGFGQKCGRGSGPHCDIVLGTIDWGAKEK